MDNSQTPQPTKKTLSKSVLIIFSALAILIDALAVSFTLSGWGLFIIIFYGGWAIILVNYFLGKTLAPIFNYSTRKILSILLLIPLATLFIHILTHLTTQNGDFVVKNCVDACGYTPIFTAIPETLGISVFFSLILVAPAYAVGASRPKSKTPPKA